MVVRLARLLWAVVSLVNCVCKRLLEVDSAAVRMMSQDVGSQAQMETHAWLQWMTSRQQPTAVELRTQP
jgi:hypothetical protein